jgi:hypothetical protein
MILGGLDLIADASGSTGFGAFVKKAIEGNNPQNHGYVDSNGMPHSRPATGTTGFAAFESRQAADGREDHNYTEQQKVTQPTTGFGAGEGIDTNMEEDRREPGNDGGLMSTSELMQKIQELLPKEERFRIPPEKKDLPPEKEPVKTADDSTPDGTQWQSEVVDNTSPRDRDLPDIPEALPEKYVPEQGDGSHPLPNESFEDWGTPPVPGVSQNYPQDPAKLTNIMGSLTRIRLSDGRVLVGKVMAEDRMRLRFFGRVAGDRADSSFELWKRDIIGPREAVRVKAPVRQAREITNLESAYALYDLTREAKDPKKDYVVEKAIVSPSDGVDRAVEKATNTRGANSMKKIICEKCGHLNDVKTAAADLGLCEECHKNPAINTFICDNGDEVNYCYECADYFGAKLKGEASRRTAADESKEKTVTPATGPKGNVATNDTMKDESFYGDDKALHDQLDKHEKRASVLKREATIKLKMADNYEKAGNIKMAKEMDKAGTILYTAWKKAMATIAGMKKEAASQRRITAAAVSPKLFFQNRETEDKNNPFS